MSFKQSTFPNAWKSAFVVPIFKAGEPTEVKNYRPISILPVVSKITEKVVAEQLTTFLNSGQDSLHPMQFGFRKNHSTEMATCYLFEKIKTNIDSGSAVGAVFLDLSKAFDTVNHSVLLSKVSNFNLYLETMKWMESYLREENNAPELGIGLHLSLAALLVSRRAQF